MKSKTIKYVIIKDKSSREKAILFDPDIIHATVFNRSNIVSAGFCRLTFDDRSINSLIVETDGESESLKIKSRLVDRDIIYKTLIPGPWDYGLTQEDSIYDEIDKLMKEKQK